MFAIGVCFNLCKVILREKRCFRVICCVYFRVMILITLRTIKKWHAYGNQEDISRNLNQPHVDHQYLILLSMRTDDGGGYGNRTRSLLRAKQTLYPVGANPPCILSCFIIITQKYLQCKISRWLYYILFMLYYFCIKTTSYHTRRRMQMSYSLKLIDLKTDSYETIFGTCDLCMGTGVHIEEHMIFETSEEKNHWYGKWPLVLGRLLYTSWCW